MSIPFLHSVFYINNVKYVYFSCSGQAVIDEQCRESDSLSRMFNMLDVTYVKQHVTCPESIDKIQQFIDGVQRTWQEQL